MIERAQWCMLGAIYFQVCAANADGGWRVAFQVVATMWLVGAVLLAWRS